MKYTPHMGKGIAHEQGGGTEDFTATVHIL